MKKYEKKVVEEILDSIQHYDIYIRLIPMVDDDRRIHNWSVNSQGTRKTIKETEGSEMIKCLPGELKWHQIILLSYDFMNKGI